MKKRAWRNQSPRAPGSLRVNSDRAGRLAPSHSAYSSAFSRFLMAALKMSPSEAPESDEPYCATACFSSAISSALIDTVMRRAALSRLVTAASTLSPTLKRSGRCSERSRDRSERLMKVVMSLSAMLHLDAVLLHGQYLAGDLVSPFLQLAERRRAGRRRAA